MISEPIQAELHLRHLVERLLSRFGASVEFWTVACLTHRELGDPQPFIADQWNRLWETVGELRDEIAVFNGTGHPALHEQVARLSKTVADLRDVFEILADYTEVPVAELEGAILKLNGLWQDWRHRVGFVAGLLPISAPLPTLTSEQETFYENALDSLFDRFYAARQTHSPSTLYRGR